MPEKIDVMMPDGAAEKFAQFAEGIADQAAKRVATYQRIGETLVAVDELNKILEILIDDYTVDKLHRTGDLISPDLLEFKQWVADRYK